MIDTVSGHDIIVFADNAFAYDKDMNKVYALSANKDLLDLKTGEKIGKALTNSLLVNTPGYPRYQVKGKEREA